MLYSSTEHFCPKVQISSIAQPLYSVHRDGQTSTEKRTNDAARGNGVRINGRRRED